MSKHFSPSVNIVRDSDKDLNYIVTPNSLRVLDQIETGFKKGIKAYSLIGSYGTAKSSFLWALERAWTKKGPVSLNIGFNPKNIKVIRIVGAYQSLTQAFQLHFGLDSDFEANQNVLDELFQLQQSSDLVLIS